MSRIIYIYFKGDLNAFMQDLRSPFDLLCCFLGKTGNQEKLHIEKLYYCFSALKVFSPRQVNQDDP